MTIVTTSDRDDTGHYLQILRLQAAYADSVTRLAWHEVGPLFADGAKITVDTRTAEPRTLHGASELCAFIGGAIERFSHFQIALLNQVVNLDPEPTGRVYTLEIRREGEEWTDAYGVYHDRYSQTGDPAQYRGWQFASRQYHSLARTGHNSQMFPFPDVR